MRKISIIDTHAHWSNGAKALLGSMDDLGIDKAIIGIPLAKLADAQIADTMEQHPGRLVPFASVKSNQDEKISVEFDYEGSIAKGIRINLSDYHAGDPGRTQLRGICERCQALNFPIYVHTQPDRHSKLSWVDPLQLDDLAYDFPEVTFMIEHSGPPWENHLIGLGLRYPNVYIALGSAMGSLVLRSPGLAWHTLEKILVHVGSDKVLWGSGYAGEAYTQEYLDFVKNAHLPQGLVESDYFGFTDEDRSKVLGGNANSILHLASMESSGKRVFSWTHEAEMLINESAPFFTRIVARRSVERFAREHNQYEITKELVEAARARGNLKF